MSKTKKTSGKEEKVITIGAENLMVPIALILVAIVVAVILVSSAENDISEDDIENTENVEGVADNANYGEYSDYITDNITTSIDDDPYLGDRDTAKIAIVEFSEYQCSYCYRHTVEVMPDIISNYVDKGEGIYVFRDLQMYGEVSEERAEIGECVNEIAGGEKFAQYHEKMKAVQFDDGEENPDIYSIVSDLGVDDTKVKECYETGKYADEIAKDAEDAKAIGIEGTPGFVVGILNEDGTVNGSLITGALPFETFKMVIDRLLEK